jgi:triacylglycerol esterase/lipase EstA (alpha/beta hydrolase family)
MEAGTAMRRRGTLLGVLALGCAVLLGFVAASAQPATAEVRLPLTNSFPVGFVTGFLLGTQPPAGANDWSCKPTARHPRPVVLVHGTFENMNDNWGAAAPLLVDNGYCVFALNYGGSSPYAPGQATGPIADSAAQLATFIDRVLAATGASTVDIVGHSQGGMMPRYYIKHLGGARKISKLVALNPSNHGTTIAGITELGRRIGTLDPTNSLLGIPCRSCVEQEVGSPFITALNSGGETVPGISYTVITTKADEVVTPYTSAFLAPAANVTNLTVQDQCGLSNPDHLGTPYDPVALTDVLNALDPARPRPVPCRLSILPIAGLL